MSSRASGLTSTMKIHEISALIAASRLAPGSDETYLHVLPRNRAFLTSAAGILLPDPSLEIRCRPSVGDGHRHRRLALVAQIDVLTVGYVGDRVAGTVVAVRDGALVAVIDPGMVANRSLILDPLSRLGLSPEQVTDVVFSHHHPDHTVNAALFVARVHDFQATYQDDEWIDREFAGRVQRLSQSVR